MTVFELMKKLENFPGKLEVIVCDINHANYGGGGNQDAFPVMKVETMAKTRDGKKEENMAIIGIEGYGD